MNHKVRGFHSFKGRYLVLELKICEHLVSNLDDGQIIQIRQRVQDLNTDLYRILTMSKEELEEKENNREKIPYPYPSILDDDDEFLDDDNLFSSLTQETISSDPSPLTILDKLDLGLLDPSELVNHNETKTDAETQPNIKTPTETPTETPTNIEGNTDETLPIHPDIDYSGATSIDRPATGRKRRAASIDQ